MIKKTTLSSFCVSMIIMVRTLSMVALNGFQSQILNKGILMFFAVVTFGTLCLGGKRERAVWKYSVIMLFLVAVSYLFHIFLGEARISVSELVLYCVIPLLAVNKKIRTELVLRYVLYLSLFSAPVLNEILEYEYQALHQIDMARAYALFIGVAAAVIHFCFCKKRNVLLVLAYLWNLHIFIKLVFVGNRGIILSAAALVVMSQITYIRGKGYPRKKKRFWRGVLFLELVAAAVLASDVNGAVQWLYDWLEERGSNIPSFLIKMRLQIMAGDVSNGRTEGYLSMLLKLSDNPFGYGMESIYRITNGAYVYPHNFILQFWLEFGVLLGTILNVIICTPIYALFSKNLKSQERKIYLLFLVSITVPKLLVSGDIWMQPQFWLLFGLGLGFVKWPRIKAARW